MIQQAFPPKPLQKGDTIAIVALASRIQPEAVVRAKELLEEWGYQVLIGESVYSSYFNFSATDEVRKRDFQKMLDNPQVKAIFSARGGYGSSRIIDEINWYLFQRSPKWVVGFSDITAVHQAIQHLGYQSIHGPMPSTFFQDAYSTTTLKHLLMGVPFSYSWETEEQSNRTGSAEAVLAGGNLCLLTHGIGSRYDVPLDGKIVFLEEVGEAHYAIDRYMVQLKRAGKLKNLAGLVVGQFSEMKDPVHYFGKTAYEIIASHVVEYDYPVAFQFPAGHTASNYALPLGRQVKLEVQDFSASLIG